MDRYFGLQVRTGAAASVEIYVNEVPWGTLAAGNATVQSLAIHVDLQPGINRVRAMVGSADVPPASARRSSPAPEDLFAALVLESEQPGTTPGSFVRDLVDQTEFRPVGASNITLPHELSLDFTVPGPFAPPAWAAARPLDAQAALPTVRELIETQHRRLELGDYDGFTMQLAERYRDHQRAFPLGPPAEQRRAEDRDNFERFFGEEGGRVLPLPLSLRMRSYVGGRLAELVQPDGSAAIQVVGADGMVQDLHHRFARLADRLVVLR